MQKETDRNTFVLKQMAQKQGAVPEQQSRVKFPALRVCHAELVCRSGVSSCSSLLLHSLRVGESEEGTHPRFHPTTVMRIIWKVVLTSASAEVRGGEGGLTASCGSTASNNRLLSSLIERREQITYRLHHEHIHGKNK